MRERATPITFERRSGALVMAVVLIAMLITSPASPHSWGISSAWGTIEPASLRCDDERCHVTMTVARWMDTERATRVPPPAGGTLDVWLDPGEVPGFDDQRAIAAWVKRQSGPVRFQGRVDSFDGEGPLDLRADFAASSPSAPASASAPFAGCGPPPWSATHLDTCTVGMRRHQSVRFTAVVEAPVTAHSAHGRVLALKHAKPREGEAMFEDNPWVVIRGKVGLDPSALSPGQAIAASGQFVLPAPAYRRGKAMHSCPEGGCFPELRLWWITRDE